MAYRAPEIVISNTLGGINEQLDEKLIKPNEAVMVQNIDIDKGVLSSKKGDSVYYDTSLNASLQSIMAFYDKTNSHLMYASNGTVYQVDKGSIGSGFTDSYFDAINFQDEDKSVIIFTNGKDPIKVYDGTTLRNLKNRRAVYSDVDDSLLGYIDGEDLTQTVKTEIECTSLAPKGKYIELHYDRIWITGNEDNPDMVYFTTANRHGWDIDDWTAPIKEGEANQHGGFINCASWDGGKVIGLKVIFDDVVIFKTKNMYKLFGTYPGNYQKVELFSSEGAISDKSIVKAHNKAYFVAYEGIFVYDGTNVLPVSDKIKDTWKNVNKNALNNACAVFYDNKYILAVPEGNSTINNLIIEYNVLSNSISLIRNINVNSFIEFGNELLFVNDTDEIKKYNSTGALSNAVYETGFTDLGSINSTKETEYLYFVGSGFGSLKFTCITDKDPVGKFIEVPLTSSMSSYRKKLKNKGRMLKLRIENVNNSSFNISNVKLTMEIDYD